LYFNQRAEEWLKKEANVADSEVKIVSVSDNDVQSALSSYASDENPDEYSSAYYQLKGFINTSLDAYKVIEINVKFYGQNRQTETENEMSYCCCSMRLDKYYGPCLSICI